MPDLTQESYAQCKSATNWLVDIVSTDGSGKTYTITLGPENPGDCQVNWQQKV
jgi:hypothetical protein